MSTHASTQVPRPNKQHGDEALRDALRSPVTHGESMRSECVVDALAPNASKGMRGGQDPSEMAQKRWSAQRQTETEGEAGPVDPEAILHDLLDGQLAIAVGNVKGTTAAQRTSASQEVQKLLVSIASLPGQEEEGVEWGDVPEALRGVCERILDRPESHALALLETSIAWDEAQEAEAANPEDVGGDEEVRHQAMRMH